MQKEIAAATSQRGVPLIHREGVVAAVPIADVQAEVKALAAVIIRRNISSTSADSQDVANADNNVNLWKRLSPEAKNFVKTELLKAINDCTDKTTIHKICSLLIEVQGTLYDQEQYISEIIKYNRTLNITSLIH